MLGAVFQLYVIDYDCGMDLDNDEFLQAAVSDFTRSRRTRRLQLFGAALLIFALGFLAGASFQYQTATITIDLLSTTV